MRYQRTAFLRDHRNPWEPFLADLRETVNPTPSPRKLAPWQLYMSKNGEEITATFDERWPAAGLPPSGALAFRSSIARELLAEETDEYRAELESEIDTMHAAGLAEAAAEAAARLPSADDRVLYVDTPSPNAYLHR